MMRGRGLWRGKTNKLSTNGIIAKDVVETVRSPVSTHPDVAIAPDGEDSPAVGNFLIEDEEGEGRT